MTMEPTLATNSQAGEDNLQELFQERAKVLREVPLAEEAGEKISILSFQLGEEVYGVELRDLTETRQSVPLRLLPSAPPHLAGIVNLRGARPARREPDVKHWSRLIPWPHGQIGQLSG